MAAHSVTLGSEQDGIAVHGPFRRTAGVTTVGQVHEFSFSVGTDQSDIGIRIVLVADELQRKPFSIGRPGIMESPAQFIPRTSVGNLTHLVRFEVQHLQADTVFDESHLLAIGRELGIHPFHGLGRQQHFFLNQSGIRKIQILFPFNFRLVELPVSFPLTGIYQRTVVCSERQSLFRFRCMRNLLGRTIFHRGHEHLSAHDESHLLAVGRNHRFRCPSRIGQRHRNILVVACQ